MKPLSGIKVLDFTRLLPGPLASLYLADMGADVVKIEDPHGGDYLRSIPPEGMFKSLNAGKKSITLDLKEKNDLLTFLNLAKKADVLLESFRPGVMKNLGLDFNSIKTECPKLIYCSISGYGQTGEDSQKAGHDINYMAKNGLLNQMGHLGNLQIADTAGGSLHAVIGIQAALLQRARSGKGQFIDISMTECSLPVGAIAYSSLGKNTTLDGSLPFYDVYETKDGKKMALGALEKKFWDEFCHAINKEDWRDWHSQVQNYSIYKEEISLLFKSKSRSEWTETLKEADCCCTPVLELSEVNTLVQKEDYYESRFPIKMSLWEYSERTPAPKLGQNNEEVESLWP